MADSDMVSRLEKQIEGSNLALAAVAEVLHKMDSRLSKAEEEELEMSQDQEDEIEKQDIIKSVAGEVYGLIKADAGNPTKAQWGSSTEVSAKSMTGTGQADDKENAVTINSKTEDANRTIQAMQLQLQLLKESLAEEGYDVEKEVYGFAKQPEVPSDEEEEEDEEDDEEEEYPEDEEASLDVQNMAKQIANIQKAVSSKKGKVQKMIVDETEKRLRKMGFSEENGLNRPKLIKYDEQSLGTDGSQTIKKAQDGEEVVDQMMSLSYGDLRRLQEQINSGETEGIPRELLG